MRRSLMAIVAGVDFGTLSVRVSIVDSATRTLGSGVAEYPLQRKKRRSRLRHAVATTTTCARWRRDARRRSKDAGVDGDTIEAIALDTTGSQRDPGGRECFNRSTTTICGAIIAPGRKPQKSPPLRAPRKARSHRLVRRHLLLRVGIREAAALAAPQSRQARALRHALRALRHGGGHALRHHRSGASVKRSVCAMGHKWMWNAELGRPAAGRVSRQASIRCSPACARSCSGALRRPPTRSPDIFRRSGPRSSDCAPAFRFPSAPSTRTGTRSARACRQGDVVNVVGTSTCIIGVGEQTAADSRRLRRGAGSVHPELHRHRSRALRHRRYLRSDRARARTRRLPSCRRASRTIAPANRPCCA